MSIDPPVDFESKATEPINYSKGGYPLQIRSFDLNKNFVYATSEYDDVWFDVETKAGLRGHDMRKVNLKFPEPPAEGTHVLGIVDGQFQWIETEEC